MARMPEQDKQDALVRRGWPIVHAVVAEVAGRVPRFVDRDELLSAGMLGLAQAAASWDEGRGVRFEHFARIRIRGAIIDELRSMDWASRSIRSRGRHMQSVSDELNGELGRAPTVEEIAGRLGRPTSEVERLRDDMARATVLRYDALADSNETTHQLEDEGPGPDGKVLEDELRDHLMDAVTALPDRLRLVVEAYFFQRQEMQDIADRLGVSPSRVSQLCSEAIALLRDGINSQLDPDAVPDLHETKGRVAKRKGAYYDAVAQHTYARRHGQVGAVAG
jgi:RNA polymerase sigma factor for flagellar operon FliA